MKEFPAQNNKTRSKKIVVIAIACGLGMVALGAARSAWFGYLIGAAMIWIAFFKKRSVANEEGIVTTYSLKPFTYIEKWTYEKMGAIIEEETGNPSVSILVFARGSMTRKMIFEKSAAEEILRFAAAVDPELYVHERDLKE
ncbi:MAG: hypothetical protein CVU86_06650 [Firmicutes bacterium HGW-Firmicutes-11]|jgi:hypothetical protein|nr:MAG: hypothetical protein CVU86_06650 [Firmicutes bacterium HGW-Firmicutes-11]